MPTTNIPADVVEGNSNIFQAEVVEGYHTHEDNRQWKHLGNGEDGIIHNSTLNPMQNNFEEQLSFICNDNCN